MLERLLISLFTGLLFVGGFFAVRPVLLRLAVNRARRRMAESIPPQWFLLLEESVSLTSGLTKQEQTGLLRTSRELLSTRHWEGCGGLQLNLDIQLVIAAQASLLVLALPGEPFPGLREILVYPRTFVPHRVCDPRKWLAASVPERALPELGEAWGNGVVVLAWDATAIGAARGQDGSNVVLHEFAHELAFQHDLARAGLSLTPWRPHVPDPAVWRRVLEDSYERLCGKVEARLPSVLDKYGATNLAEFFAVATETFFERPRELRREYPHLYDQLRGFYRQDPARRAAA